MMNLVEFIEGIEMICHEFIDHDEMDKEFNKFWYKIMNFCLKIKQELILENSKQFF